MQKSRFVAIRQFPGVPWNGPGTLKTGPGGVMCKTQPPTPLNFLGPPLNHSKFEWDEL
jgi:hypothetical protein